MAEPQLDPGALVRLLHLASPALPIGAFAYSQGLEPAVAAGVVHDEATAATWILGLLRNSLATLEVPALARLAAAWDAGDAAVIRRWNDFVFASRPTAELQAEDRRLGAALARVLVTLGITEARPWADDERVTQVNLFARATSHFRIPVAAAATALLFAWAENQAAAAMRLVPLGQSAGVRLLGQLPAALPAICQQGLALSDDQMGQGAPWLAIASCRHETQYSRLFRS